MKVESFNLDHTKVTAPYVRKCSVLKGEKGDTVTKFDLRFTQPNETEMQSEGMHTLEHLLATYLREVMDCIIDLSPMGCRTGFYLTVWGEPGNDYILQNLKAALEKVAASEEIPAANAVQCGNYKLHDLEQAKYYAKEVFGKEWGYI